MATIKSFTDLLQSKVLAEFLPLESADMCYVWDYECMFYTPELFSFIQNQDNEGVEHIDYPCWSLAALLGVLPNNKVKTTTMSKGGWSLDPIDYIDKWFVEYEDEEHTNDFHVSADEPVDACVEMIEKLSKEGLL